MKRTHPSAAITAAIPPRVTVTAWFRNTKTRLFAVALSLAAFTQVFGQPVIITQPQSQTGSVGGNVTFSVSADGIAPFSYQWRRNETALAGEINDTLTLRNVQFAQTGSYTVVVSDGFEESVTSDAATLTVVPGTFTKITTGAIVNDGGASVGGSWADYDNDGWLDLFVANTLAQHDFLYRNNRDGTFTRITAGVVVNDGVNSSGPAWGDYNNDGYPDLFVTTPGNDLLYRNNGDGTFTRITTGPPTNDSGTSNASSWADYDNDGYLDLYVSNNPGPRFLYRNNRDGTFTKVTDSIIVTDPSIGFGCAWGDYDNDGWLDLFVCNGSSVSVANNFLYHNNGDGTFTKITSGAIATDSGRWTRCAWGDYDNDGFLDLFVTDRTGNNALYHNERDGTFTRITSGSLVNDGGNSFGCAWGDYDNDGFLDLFVGNGRDTGDENNFLYRNNGNSNNWIKVRLVGTLSNRSGIGAKIKVNAIIDGANLRLTRHVDGGEFNGNVGALVVGLGDATHIEMLRIEWPSGTVQELENVASKQFLTVTEPGGEPRLLATRENGQVHLTLTGKQGSRYAIETSTALPNWTGADLTVTVTNQSGTVTFPAPSATSGALRFYRAVLR